MTPDDHNTDSDIHHMRSEVSGTDAFLMAYQFNDRAGDFSLVLLEMICSPCGGLVDPFGNEM